MSSKIFGPADTREDQLPPWEIAKAYAFHVVLRQMEQTTRESAAVLLGGRVDAYIASQVYLANGKHPSARAVRQVVERCSDSSWYPGKRDESKAGRPPVIIFRTCEKGNRPRGNGSETEVRGPNAQASSRTIAATHEEP